MVRAIIISGVVVSQVVLFWGLDILAKKTLLPNIAFEQPYRLHGESGDVQGAYALSKNSSYLAWINGGVLYVEDLVARRCCYRGEQKTDSFVWLPDRSRLVFVSENQLYSLDLEGEVRLNRETEAQLPEGYTYTQIAVSTYSNLIYLMGAGPEGRQDILIIDLTKKLRYVDNQDDLSFSRLAVVNKTGSLVIQAETRDGPRLLHWAENTLTLISDDGGIGDAILLGTNDRGFYGGRIDREADCFRTVYYYVNEAAGVLEEPVAIWQGELPMSAEFLPFATGAGLLVSPEENGESEAYVIKMVWGANHEMGLPRIHVLGLPLFREAGAPRPVCRVFAANGLTYLEISGDQYCWRLLP